MAKAAQEDWLKEVKGGVGGEGGWLTSWMTVFNFLPSCPRPSELNFNIM